jgi:hypothetical protein
METKPKEPNGDVEPRGFEQYDFPGITVIVPQQVRDQIVAIEKGSINLDKLNYSGFNLIRYIANIALVKKADYDQDIISIVDTFDPPIELRVSYNFYDAMKAECGIDQLKLAYWSGSEWVIFNNHATFKYRILPPSTAQVAEVTIYEWAGDPPLAWGG